MDGFYITVKNGLLDPKHFKGMHGDKDSGAIWLFLWLLDRLTIIDSEKGEGKVLGGKPIKFEEIQQSFNITRRTYYNWLAILRDGKYITTIRTAYGLSFTVYKAFKVFKSTSDVKSNAHLEKRDVKTHDTRDVSSPFTSQYIDNTVDNTVTNNTNVLLGGKAPKVYGDEFIQKGLKLLKEYYPDAGKLQLNAFALQRLKKKGDRAFKAFKYAYEHKNEKYCPQIYNFMDLEEKWVKLEAFSKRNSEQTSYVKIS